METDPIPGLKDQLATALLADTANLNHLVAARTLGIDEARMSNLKYHQLERFSLQRLIRLLARMNRKVEVSIVVMGPLPRLNWRALNPSTFVVNHEDNR